MMLSLKHALFDALAKTFFYQMLSLKHSSLTLLPLKHAPYDTHAESCMKLGFNRNTHVTINALTEI